MSAIAKSSSASHSNGPVPSVHSVGKARRITGTVLIVLISLLLISTSVAKFAHVPKVVTQLESLGIDGNKLTLVAVLEITSGVLLLMPRTRSVGLIFVAGYLGGAIATHVQHNQIPEAVSPLILLALASFGLVLRHPIVLWSFRGGR
jgi:hypothetical protein